jgi:hypothetical protein
VIILIWGDRSVGKGGCLRVRVYGHSCSTGCGDSMHACAGHNKERSPFPLPNSALTVLLLCFDFDFDFDHPCAGTRRMWR